MNGYLSGKQVEQLLRPIKATRVLSRDGMAYVEGYDVVAHLNRVFGFGRWSSEVVTQTLICEEAVQTKAGKPAWYVVYRSVVKLTVCAPDGTTLATYTEGHVGESTHPVRGEAHGNAVTNSETYALKRSARMLGDQFGLSLYAKGSTAPVVRGTLVHPDPEADNPEALPAADPVVPEQDTDSAPAPEDPPVHPAGPGVTPPVSDDPSVREDEAAAVPSQEGFSPEAEVGRLRAAVLDACEKDKREALKALTRINLTAGKLRLLQAPTTTVAGGSITLGALIDTAIRNASRAGAA